MGFIYPALHRQGMRGFLFTFALPTVVKQQTHTNEKKISQQLQQIFDKKK
jgi:hypothetical protein